MLTQVIVGKEIPISKIRDMQRLNGRFARSLRYADTSNSPSSNSASCISQMVSSAVDDKLTGCLLPPLTACDKITGTFVHLSSGDGRGTAEDVAGERGGVLITSP